MQTKIEVLEKVLELSKDLHITLLKEVETLLQSSVVDLSAHNNDFVLPKILYIVALRKIASSYTPLSPEYREILREIEVWT